MPFYTYTVKIGLDGNAQPGQDTVTSILRTIQAESTLSKPGAFEVTGVLNEKGLLAAGETMRLVLNRIVLSLGGDGFRVIQEGWELAESEEPEEAASVNPDRETRKTRAIEDVPLPDDLDGGTENS